jgi:phosphoglycolate phosphatase
MLCQIKRYKNQVFVLDFVTPDHQSVDAVIIDLDGTLLDTVGDFVAALNLMLVDLALPAVERAAVLPLVGKGSEYLIQGTLLQVLSETPLDGATQKDTALDARVTQIYRAAWQSYQRHYLDINGQHALVYPGVMEGLEAMASHGLKLACLTNKPQAFAMPLLQDKGLAGFFSVVFGGDSFVQKKPHALPVLKTCAALGSLPARTLMIGDSSNDAQAARAAACPVVLVTYGYNHGQPVREVDADGYIDSLAQLRWPN